MAQTIKPDSIDSFSGWNFVYSGSWESAIQNSDSYYAYTTGNNTILRATLQNATDPGIDTGHKVHYRIKYDPLLFAETVTLRFRVKESGVPSALYTFDHSPVPLSEQSHVENIPSLAVGNYNNLLIEAEARGNETGNQIQIDYMYLEVPDLDPPPVPTGISATDGTYTNKVRITWNAAARATQYDVQRATSSGGPYSSLGAGDGNPTSNTWLEDTGDPPTPGVTYWYRVRAENSAGNSSYSSADSGYAQVTAIVVSPSAITAGSATEAVASITLGSIVVTPSSINARTRTKTPLSLEETDVDGFFSYMAQPFGYTNYNTRQRDTYCAVDSNANLIYWLFPTSSSSGYTKQLPRVMYAVNLQDNRIGLAVPMPLNATGAYTALKSKNIFFIGDKSPGPFGFRESSVWCINPATVTEDDITTDTEVGSKEIGTLVSEKFIGMNSPYSDAVLITKFFRPPTREPDTKTRIRSITPRFTRGYTRTIDGLKMRGYLWTFDTMAENDTARAAAPDISTELVYSGEELLFEGSVFGLEHVVGISIDTSDGASAFDDISKSQYLTTGPFMEIDVDYEVQSRNKF